MVILSENSCHCNAMQCNFNEGDKLDAHRPLPITVNCTRNSTTLEIKSSETGQSIIGENEMERFSILKMMAIWHMMHTSSSSS